MKVVTLNKGKHRRILDGHPWIFSNEIGNEKNVEAGSMVRVEGHNKKFIGYGYYNPNSEIRIRLLSRNEKEVVDHQFFYDRIKQCIDYRKKNGYENNYRVVFSEGDFIPGLIIDKFNDVLVLQTLTLGMDRFKNEIVRILNDLLQPKGIYERNDAPVRELEGLKQQAGFLSGQFETKFFIEEQGVKLLVDVEHGQKTGFFLDQKENRLMLKNVAQNATVLDCFCYTASFSAFAAHFGAREITALDISEPSITLAKEVAGENNFSEKIKFISANAFDVMPEMVKEKKKFDIVILDPPAFTKRRSEIVSAVRGYKEINLRAMKLLTPGGFLLTFSCSRFMDVNLFYETIQQAAADAGRTIREVAFLSQAKDHPIVWGIPETFYLKGLMLQVI